MSEKTDQPFKFDVIEIPERDDGIARLDIARRMLVAMLRRALPEAAASASHDKASGKQGDAA